MSEDRRSKMLEKVRALIAKADATTFEGEADVFRAKADELMTAYAIESWQVEQAQNGVNARPKPELRQYDISWYRWDNEFRDQLWNVFHYVAQHCRIQAVTRKIGYGEQKLIPLVGLPADLDYFDLLFTTYMLEMGKKLEPKPTATRTVEDNVYEMRSASMGWPRIAQLMLDAGMVEPPRPAIKRYERYAENNETWKDHVIVWRDLTKNEQQALRSRLAKTYRDYVKATGKTQTFTNPKVYQRNFADGFAEGVWLKVHEMGRAQTEGKGSGVELALRDIRQVVKEAMWEFFPDLRPHPADCECADCHTRKCKDPDCDRPRCKEKRKPIRYRQTRELAYDRRARSAGSQAAREVRVANSQGERLRSTPELPR